MKQWLRKFSFFLISFITLGAIVPANYLDAQADNKDPIYSKSEEEDKLPELIDSTIEDELSFLDDFNDADDIFEDLDISDYFIHLLAEQAKEEMMNKLGPKILKQVETDLVTTIMPNMEEVLQTILQEVGKEDAEYFGISANPSEGYGEKIFKIYDERTNLEVARFDVRRDNRPKEGYWFNFHYHLSEDNFEEHHHLGDVYWDKNTPPKWKS